MGLRALLVLSVVLAACSIRVTANDDEENRVICGNGHVDPGEVCDDGNAEDGDGCSADCTSDESCGNGVVDTAVGESCDDGDALGGDGCSADCKSTEECGNGVTDLANGETCDDGNLIGGDMCSANCQSNEMCGNFVTDIGTIPVETCDDGPAGSAMCNKNCTKSVCRDGIVNLLAGEECDDNNANNGDGCDNLCRKVQCGDNRVTGNEPCDDSNSNSTDGCIACVLARCGDGFVHAGFEQCDDNNNTNGDGCDANCNWEPRVYLISDSGRLINQESNCSMDGQSFYDGCGGGDYGISWDDNTPFQPSSIQLELIRGIDCHGVNFGDDGSQPKATSLNGTYDGDITLQGPPLDDFSACTCDPVPQYESFSLAANGYQTNTANSLTFTGSMNPGGGGSCAGLSFDAGLGGFARITVFP